MGSSGGPSNTTTTSTTALPSWAQPYAQQYLTSLANQVMPGGQLAPSSSIVAPFSPYQQEALGAIGGMGASSPLTDAATQQQIATIQGQYMNPATNPALQAYSQQADQQLVNAYNQTTGPQALANSALQGDIGSSGAGQQQAYNQYGLGQNLASLNAQIYEPAYESAAQQQQTAAQNAGNTLAASYYPAQQLLSAGGTQQQQQQQQLNAPYTLLQQLGGGIGTAIGNAGSNVTVSPNQLAGMK